MHTNSNGGILEMTDMAENQDEVRRARRNAGLELALTVGPTFGGLMGLGWLLGSKLDARWGTEPTMVVICVLAGTIAGFFHLITVARRLE